VKPYGNEGKMNNMKKNKNNFPWMGWQQS
jgi:hypothetical protein